MIGSFKIHRKEKIIMKSRSGLLGIFIFSIFLLAMVSNMLGQEIVAEAVEDSTIVYRMGEIVITADRAQVVRAAAFNEIKSVEISRLDIHQPVDVLNFSPGLHVYKISTNETTFMLRGFEQRQVCVFLDGVPISVPYDGKVDLAQLVGDDLHSIRVSRGVSSALYGANTMGGSVNIITSAFGKPANFNLRLEGVDYGAYFANVNYHNQFGNLKYALNVSLDRSNDFPLSDNFKPTTNENGQLRNNSDYEKKGVNSKLHYTFNERHQLGFNVNYIDNWYHIPPNTKMQRVRYWRFPEWKKTVVSLNSLHLFSGQFMLRTVLFYDKYYNVLKSYDDDTYTSQSQKYAWNSTYDDHSLGFIVYPSLKLFSFGSTNGIISYKDDIHKEEFRDFGFDTYEMATFTAGVEQDINITNKQTALIGMDINYLNPLAAEGVDLRDPITLVNGQAAWQYMVNPDFSIHVSAGKKSRFPTLKELYSERLSRTEPNPDLKHEQSYNTELGIRKHFSKGMAQIALFYNSLQDLITYREIGDGKQQLQNIGKALIRGLEIDLRWQGQQIDSQINYTFLDAQNQSDNHPDDHLPNRPAHRLNIIGQWNFLNKMSLGIEGNYVADQYYENPDNLIWEKLNDYTVINLKYSYKILTSLKWYVRANNISDTNYETDYGVTMPGRTILTGIRLGI